MWGIDRKIRPNDHCLASLGLPSDARLWSRDFDPALQRSQTNFSRRSSFGHSQKTHRDWYSRTEVGNQSPNTYSCDLLVTSLRSIGRQKSFYRRPVTDCSLTNSFQACDYVINRSIRASLVISLKTTGITMPPRKVQRRWKKFHLQN